MTKLWLGIVVITVLNAQSAQSPSELLEKARDKILDSTRRLPKYTCLETIDRTYYVAPPAKKGPHIMTEAPAVPVSSCTVNAVEHLTLDAKDRLRLEVAAAGKGEIRSWPGASSFDTRPIDQMIPGPISSGSFGTSLVDVFENPGTQFKFTGRKTDGGRDVFEYTFRVPFETSHLEVKTFSGWKVAEFSGSFEINAATAELARLVIEPDHLTPDSGMCQAKTTIDYHFMLIGDGEFLIPLQSEFQTFRPDGSQTDSVTAFSSCHEYTAESSVRFDDLEGDASSLSKSPKVATALPGGISLTLALTGSIDTRTAAAGDPVSAKVTNAVRAPGSKEILVPAGAMARGRLLQMRHDYSTSQFLISVRFDTLEIQGAISPLSVSLSRNLRPESRSPRGFRTRGTEFSLPPVTSGETGSPFVLPARTGRATLPAGYRSTWITVAP